MVQTEDDPLISRASSSDTLYSTSSSAAAAFTSAGDKKKIHRVSYTARNHVQVLFQMYGSALPQVLPFCLANVIWTLLVYYLRKNEYIDMTFDSVTGHSFMGLLVSFLVVARCRISYDRFMEMRRHLAVTYRAIREISQFTCVYTFKSQSLGARRWRDEVLYRSILLLRVTMDALKWASTERHAWERDFQSEHKDRRASKHFKRFSSFSHADRTLVDENFRATILFAHVLRETIMTHPEALGYTMPVNEYRDLLNFVTTFIEAFHGFRVLIFTPYPFSLLQMTRMFLFFWVYSLPLVLIEELHSIGDVMIIVFILTFGFVGLEYVSLHLDNPFGDGEVNDVDEHGMALLVYEDVYLALYRTDGTVAATKLRDRVVARYKEGRGLDCYHEDLLGEEFWERWSGTAFTV